MSNDRLLKKIKKYYGEGMKHYCCDAFSSIPLDLLCETLFAHFTPYNFLYNDMVNYGMLDSFRNYIYSFFPNENKDIINVDKTLYELFREKGYNLFYCKTIEDVFKFRKYYGNDSEELCSFRNNKLDRYHLFFAVRDDADRIRREDFEVPHWNDSYSTSVLFIKVSKGKTNFMSITGRYNTVGIRTNDNADNLFNSNLDNINLGLQNAFSKEYKFNFTVCRNDFRLPNYVCDKTGKFYKYNYIINDIYYCVDNVIIDKDGSVIDKYLEREKYIVLDYFILDLRKNSKSIALFDEEINDSFINGIKDITRIDIKNDGDNRIINICTKNNKIIIVIDDRNRIIEYYNDSLEIINDNFMLYNEVLSVIDISNAKIIGNNCLRRNTKLKRLFLNAFVIGDYFMLLNKGLEVFCAPFLESVGIWFLYSNNSLKKIDVPNIKKMGDKSLMSNLSKRLEVSSRMMQEQLVGVYNSSIKEIEVATQSLTENIKNGIKSGKFFIKNISSKLKIGGGHKR